MPNPLGPLLPFIEFNSTNNISISDKVISILLTFNNICGVFKVLDKWLFCKVYKLKKYLPNKSTISCPLADVII